MKRKIVSVFLVIVLIISIFGFKWYSRPDIEDELNYYKETGFKVKENNWVEYKNEFAEGQLLPFNVNKTQLRERANEINNTLGFCTIFVDYEQNILWAHIIVSYGQKVAVYYVKY